MQNKKCARCGKEFKPKSGTQRFCTRKCYFQNEIELKKARRGEKVCLKCGEKFIPSTDRQKYCSRKCLRAYLNEIKVKSKRVEIFQHKDMTQEIIEVNEIAQKFGLSYGEAVAKGIIH